MTCGIVTSYFIAVLHRHVCFSLSQARWYVLLFTSIVVLAAAVEYSNSLDCGSNKEGSCKSNRYAQSFGALVMMIALGVIPAMCLDTLNVWVEIVTVVIVLGLYTAGVALVTFDDGSGTSIGNLYFSIWLGFLVTVFLSVDAYKTLMDLWAKKRATKKAAPREAVSETEKKGRETKAEVDSDIDENEFYEAEDEESNPFKYISNA
jgi:uncharacterized membrane protein